MKLLRQLIVVTLVFPLFLPAQTDSLQASGKLSEKEGKNSIFAHFSKDPSITQVTLTTDVDSLADNKFRDFEIPSTFSYHANGKEVTWNVKISPRGKSRKMICDMPPFLLNFSKDELKKEGLKTKHDKLKLVNYCKDGKKYQYYLLREYLIYKMYNIITENSFNVKLVNVNYVDAQNDIKPESQYSFLIEDTDELADRLKAKEENKFGMSADSCNSFDYNVLCLFQYMIGNTDWNLALSHNTKFIKKKKSEKLIPVPYDFDYSGLVNADYSVPNPDYFQYDVRHRIYIGEYPPDEEMEKVIQLFKDKKKEIYALINDFELLDKGWRKDMIHYLDKFYKYLNNPKRLKSKCLSSQKESSK